MSGFGERRGRAEKSKSASARPFNFAAIHQRHNNFEHENREPLDVEQLPDTGAVAQGSVD
jgi:hypothetical protein